MVGPKNLLFLLEDGNPKKEQILRCAQNDTIAFCYTATLKMVEGFVFIALQGKSVNSRGQRPRNRAVEE